MAKTPRFNYVVENYKKMVAENNTPHLTGPSNPNQSATPVSDSNPNANRTIDPEKTKTLLAAYQKTAQSNTAPTIQPANQNVPQVPVPGQGPTNPSTPVTDPNAPETPVLTHDDNKKALYDHLVNDLGLTDEMVADIFKK